MASFNPPTPTLQRELSDEGRRLLQEALQTSAHAGFGEGGGGGGRNTSADPHRDHDVQVFEGEVSIRMPNTATPAQTNHPRTTAAAVAAASNAPPYTRPLPPLPPLSVGRGGRVRVPGLQRRNRGLGRRAPKVRRAEKRRVASQSPRRRAARCLFRDTFVVHTLHPSHTTRHPLTQHPPPTNPISTS